MVFLRRDFAYKPHHSVHVRKGWDRTPLSCCDGTTSICKPQGLPQPTLILQVPKASHQCQSDYIWYHYLRAKYTMQKVDLLQPIQACISFGPL
jgi:hypothetical protein